MENLTPLLVALISVASTGGLTIIINLFSKAYRKKRDAGFVLATMQSELDTSELRAKQLETEEGRWDFLMTQLQKNKIANMDLRVALDASNKQIARMEEESERMVAGHVLMLTKVSFSLKHILTVCNCSAHTLVEELYNSLDSQKDAQ